MAAFRFCSLVPVLAAALLGACVPPPQGPGALPPAVRAPAAIGQLDRAPVGRKGIVSAADPRAADAGAQILRRGGTATDAAIAVMLALTVVEPQSSGIGGGGFLVVGDQTGQVEIKNRALNVFDFGRY